MTGTTIDLLATAMGDWHGCTNNGKGGHLPPCRNCQDRAQVCATALDALAEPPTAPKHAASGPGAGMTDEDVDRFLLGWAQGVADAGARLVGIVANDLGPDSPTVARMVAALGQLVVDAEHGTPDYGDDWPVDVGPVEAERLADVARWRAEAEHHLGPDGAP